MARNRELSQLGSFVIVNDTNKNIGIATTATPNVGIGTTNPTSKLTIFGPTQIQQDSDSNNRLILRGQPGSSYRWNIDNYSSVNEFRIYREDDPTAANGAVAVAISSSRDLTVNGNVTSTGTVYGSGNVIQVGFSTSPGGSTASTTLVNSQGSLFTFTPKRSDSTIYQIWNFQAITSTVATTNTLIFFAIAEGNTNTKLVSPVYTAYSIESSDGDGMASMASIQVSVASTGTSTRSFSVFFRSNTATNTVYATDIRCTFIEVAS